MHGGVCTVGSVITKPGIVTAVVGEAEMTLDQRHLDANKLAQNVQGRARRQRAHRRRGKRSASSGERSGRSNRSRFNPELIEMTEQSIKEVCGTCHPACRAVHYTTPPKSAARACRQ